MRATVMLTDYGGVEITDALEKLIGAGVASSRDAPAC